MKARQSSLTHRFAAFLAGIRFSDLTPEVRRAAVRAVTDAVGCGLAGTGDPGVDTLVRTLSGQGEQGSCPSLAGQGGFSPGAAALINGTMIHAREMDDTHSFSSVHTGGPVVGAALALAAVRGTDGPGLLEGVVAGYEAACRLGMAVRGPGPYHRGFHPTGTCGVFGACAAAARMQGLDAESTAQALGISGSMASGLMSYLQNGAWTKKMHPGWAARNGLLAAALAAQGFRGPQDILQGCYDFPGAYADAFDPEVLLDGLGGRFEVTRMSYKPFACCRSVHPEITAALKFRKRPGFDPKRIRGIHAVIADEDLSLVVEPLAAKKRPGSVVEAQFSMPFGLALALARGEAMPVDFQEGLHDPLVRRLSDMVSFEVNDAFTAMRPALYPCRLHIDMGGEWSTVSVEAPLGDYSNPMSDREMQDKFLTLSQPVLGRQGALSLQGFLASLDRASSIRPLFEVMGQSV
ncbi:MAG: MmgE/PrpD family protein [Desulfovibrionales bacterium]